VTIPFYFPLALALLFSNAVWVTYLHTGADHYFPGMAGALHHRLHHYYGENSCNYALYFQFWDRLMGESPTPAAGSPAPSARTRSVLHASATVAVWQARTEKLPAR
jgi:sterol desaturase/sphingolipid hydroxylase (fatty acid hydroxylase superfamily)